MRTLTALSLAVALATVAMPAAAQRYEPDHGPGGRAHVEEYRAQDAASEARDHFRHARRDAAAGDYHGAEHAQRRAYRAADDAARHGEAARHGRADAYGYRDDRDDRDDRDGRH